MATVAAATSVLEAGMAPDPRFIDGLRDDADRLEALLQLMRQLPRRAGAALEPMLLTDAAEVARRLAEEHPAMRGRAIVVRPQGDVQPMRAEPGAVTHATVVAVLAAARMGDGPVLVDLRTEGDEVCLSARCEHTAGGGHEGLAHDHRAIDWLLTQSHGRAHPDADACTFRLPTLQASRRRSG